MTNTEAITKLTNIMHDDHYSWHPSILTAFGMAVDALRQSECARWMPTSEMLPELHDEPWCIDDDGREFYESDPVFITVRTKEGYKRAIATLSYITEHGYGWDNAEECASYKLSNVLAWMPLPEPYREEGD